MQVPLVQPVAVPRAQQRLQPGVAHDLHPERIGDRLQGDVVVRRSDAARREHHIEPRRQRAHAVRDLLGHVGHDLDPAQRDAQGAKLPRQKTRVLVLHLAGQDLVPDEQDGGGRVGRWSWAG